MLHSARPFQTSESLAFLVALLISALLGTLISILFREARNQQGVKEGFAIVTLGWITMTLIGAIPFMVWFIEQRSALAIGDILVAFTDAFFEIMSGFTTTGSTILTDIEVVPRGLLFWRSLTHWLGGMGIITLALAIFPAMGVGGYQMFRGEVPGPSADRLSPRLRQTSIILWGVYLMMSIAETILLRLGGMSLFDSICHTFGTMATGGFSTRNASVGAYNSAYIDWVIIVFMFLAGTNFLIHYRVLFKRDWFAIKENREFHFYSATIVIATIVIALLLFAGGLPDAAESAAHFTAIPAETGVFAEHVAAEGAKVSTFNGALRYSAFQVVAIVTTTGFGTADFDIWPRAIGLILVILMFWGGCAGSTGGGMKMIRVMVTMKAGWRELKKITRPRLVAPLKIHCSPLPEHMVSNIIGFSILFIGLFVICSIIMSLFVPDLTSAVTSVAATIGNIGPGLSGIGSTQNFAWIPTPGKWVLILCMLLGRLEIFTVLVLLRPSFWKK
ncbi:MAG: TrkH family potassium uptake protein [bacterium]|nr:TrkH family potassium uptake protein [bacterium]